MKLIILLLLAAQALAQDVKTNELLDVTYRGHADLSTLTLTFSEPPQCLRKRIGKNRIRLTFPNTTSAKYANKVPLIFKSGHARSLAFDFSRVDTVAVLVTLAENVEFDLRKPPGAPRIALDVYAKDTTSAGALPVDLASIVKQQIDEANATEKAKTAAHRSTSASEIHLIPLLVAVVMSTLGTAWLLRRIVKSPRATVARPVRSEHPAPRARVDAILDQAKVILQEKAVASAATGESKSDDPMASLARKFERAQGDVRLARTLEERNRELAWQKKMHRLGAQHANATTQAKKLGVGKGEVALAVSLRKMQDQQRKKELVP